MLQQTQVATVIPYYLRWLKRFPDVKAIAEAPEDEILKHWEGMGYYARAQNLQKTARILLSECAGEFPSDHQTVMRLPGIGPYTAGAIMSLAFNQDVQAVDGETSKGSWRGCLTSRPRLRKGKPAPLSGRWRRD